MSDARTVDASSRAGRSRRLVARRRVLLDGVEYAVGDVVPVRVLCGLPDAKIRTLVRLGRLAARPRANAAKHVDVDS